MFRKKILNGISFFFADEVTLRNLTQINCLTFLIASYKSRGDPGTFLQCTTVAMKSWSDDLPGF